MHTRVSLFFSVALAATIVSSGWAGVEGPYYGPEPWAGWWWPQYCTAECPYCPHHLWKGPPVTEDGAGPIYKLDTKYFWRDVSRRYLAQQWEMANHRTTGHTGDGHCNGLACASILEPIPPDDGGHLSQSDLKGLLTELYYATQGGALTDRYPYPSDLWLACRASLHPLEPDTPKPFILDFYCDPSSGPGNPDIVDWYAVYGYRVSYVVHEEDVVSGTLTLYYEGRYTSPDQTGNRPCTKHYAFTGVQMQGSRPLSETGTWIGARPDQACRPLYRILGAASVNRYLDTVEIRRVINRLTIVHDDERPYEVGPPRPGGEWVQRQGYSGGCWASPGVEGIPPSGKYYTSWYSRLGATGQWRYYIYKTRPQGDVMNRHTAVCLASGDWVYVDQSAPPFDEWQLVATRWREQGSYRWLPYICNTEATPVPCRVYMDALKLDYAGPAGGDAGQSAQVGPVPERPRLSMTANGVAIHYALVAPTRVRAVVYDQAGRKVRELLCGQQNAGEHRLAWDGSGSDCTRSSRGVYFIVLDRGTEQDRLKAVVALTAAAQQD